MMHYLLILIFLILFSVPCLSQRVLSSDSDTSFWYHRYHLPTLEQLNLTELKETDADFAFRFWDGRKYIELFERKGKLEGSATFVLKEYVSEGDGRYYHSQLKLDSINSSWIKNLIVDLGIIELPTDKQIDGWRQGFDGFTYLIETANDKEYSFKNYWTPSRFREIKEARLLLYFMNELNTMNVLIEANEKFMNNQPFKSYYTFVGGGVIATVLRRNRK